MPIRNSNVTYCPVFYLSILLGLDESHLWEKLKERWSWSLFRRALRGGLWRMLKALLDAQGWPRSEQLMRTDLPSLSTIINYSMSLATISQGHRMYGDKWLAPLKIHEDAKRKVNFKYLKHLPRSDSTKIGLPCASQTNQGCPLP